MAPPGGSAVSDLAEYLRTAVSEADEERATFMKGMELVSASPEEKHFLDWEMAAVQGQLEYLDCSGMEASARVSAVSEEMRLREAEMDQVRSEQNIDRERIQRLLALSQPTTPDVTMCFEGGVKQTRGEPPQLGLPQRSSRLHLCSRGYEKCLMERLKLYANHIDALERAGRDYLTALEADDAGREGRVREHISRAEKALLVCNKHMDQVEATELSLAEATKMYLSLRRTAQHSHASSKLLREQCQEKKQQILQEERAYQEQVAGERQHLAADAERKLGSRVASLRHKLGETEIVLQGVRAEYSAQIARHKREAKEVEANIVRLQRKYKRLSSTRISSIAVTSGQATTCLKKEIAKLERQLCYPA